METEISSFVANLRLGEAQVHNHVMLVPIFGPEDGQPAYRTLGEALAAGTLVVSEVSQAGSVPELKVSNRGQRPVLLVDGEEVSGAKQNRVLNTSILLKENSDTVIPVSCTEHGRWGYSSAVFAESGAVLAHKIRSSKLRSVSASLAREAKHVSDQGEVWAQIAELQAQAKVSSPTGAMHDVFQARQAELEASQRAFPVLAGQQGLLVVIDGEVAGLDFVSQPEAYARLHAKLLKSYLIEAVVTGQKAASEAGDPREKARAFLDEAAQCSLRRFPSVGHGTDLRFEKTGLAGSALEHEGRVVHAAFFRVPPENAGENITPLRHRRRSGV